MVLESELACAFRLPHLINHHPLSAARFNNNPQIMTLDSQLQLEESVLEKI